MNSSKCPKCGNPTDLSAESCPSCGIIFSRYYMNRIAEKTKTKTGSRSVRLIIDVLLGIFGIAATLTGFVVLFSSCSHNPGAAHFSGGSSCLVLGSISIIAGIVSIASSFYGITSAIR